MKNNTSYFFASFINDVSTAILFSIVKNDASIAAINCSLAKISISFYFAFQISLEVKNR
ncbi:hypothetical protein [Spiroplasma endosymbiont of Polydrusus pterygomalis]|uniref:hypothetical protein n=1 Tax=Spiroplasma endosymbiont of Polydrusus pterygomalis TaxID=3139327 RepID=UPI003CCB4B2E